MPLRLTANFANSKVQVMRYPILTLVTSVVLAFFRLDAQAAGPSDVQPALLVGAWKLTGAFVDSNRNSKLEDGERQAPMPGMQDYLRLNSDGTCEFYVMKVRGRYELQPRSDGTKKLVLFDKDNNKEDRGLIYSVSNTELVLLNFSTRLFSVYTKQ